MEGVDLNLDNYSLDDLLSLFSLPVNFSAPDLRQARRVVASSHPDRSRLPGAYFNFFNRAYGLLEQVYRAQASREDAAIRESRGPRPEELEYEAERDEALASTLAQYSEKPGFNRVFNDLFEKHGTVTHKADGGHGVWLTAGSEPIERAGSREEIFSKCKSDARALVRVDNIEAAGLGGSLSHSDLVADNDGSFGSSTSSTLPFQDLRQAHEMSVIPVTEEADFGARKKYSDVGQLKADREVMDRVTSMPSIEQSRRLLEEREAGEREAGAHRAYKLAQQHDRARDANAQMLAGLLRLTGPGTGR